MGKYYLHLIVEYTSISIACVIGNALLGGFGITLLCPYVSNMYVQYIT